MRLPAGQIVTLIKKDLQLEWRGRSRMVAVLLFGVVTLFLFSFALGPDMEAIRAASGGFLTLALLLSSTLALSESFRIETEDRALEGLMLVPVEPPAIFYSKAISNTLLLLLLAPVLVPVALVLYALEPGIGALGKLFLTWGLISAGLAAPGTLYAGMTSRIRSQDVLLPVLLFPLVMPVLAASAKVIGLILTGDPMDQVASWMWLLTAFDVIYWSLCGLLFVYVIEE